MGEEKNSLLGYLLCTPEERTRVYCREMDRKQNIADYTLEDLQRKAGTLGKFLDREQEMGEHIPLFLETSYEFLCAFFGVLAAKKVCVPIHTTANDESIGYVLEKIRAKCLVVTQPWLYRKLVGINYVREHIHTILTSAEVIAQKALPSRHIDIGEILKDPIPYEESQRQILDLVATTSPDEVAQIVFTSGTTGQPKGAVLSHRNVISCVVRAGNHLNIHSGYKSLTFLPLSHVMGQNEIFIALVNRAMINVVGRDNLLHGLKTFAPNILVSVPRVYQAIHQGIQRKLRDKPLAQKLIGFNAALQGESKRSRSLPKRLLARLFVKTIGRVLTSKIRQNLGKFNILVTAGASCPEYIYDFYESIGIPLTNAQGLTEVSGAIIYNNPNETHKGSIGYPLPGVEVKIDEDGEIMMKGDPVFKGYFEEPEANATSFAPGGWFRTGDLGRMEMIEGKPYIFLEGRKKEIVVLSSGVNVPPVQIEEKLLQHEIIHQAVIVGDGKPRLGALIVPDNGYCNNENIREEISKIIRQVNAQMDASERIGNFEIIPEPFTVENGMLTPTLKMRRPVIFQRYKDLIGQLYNTPA